MNVAIVCGGTGGHLFPGLALGEELLARRHQVLLVVSRKEIDRIAIRGTAGFTIRSLPAVGWRGWRPDYIARFAVMMLQSVFEIARVFREYPPDVVVGMGGFSSVAPLLLARMRGVPGCIHESNAITGKANRWLAGSTSVVALGFEGARAQLQGRRTMVTGTPVRAALRAPRDRGEARSRLGIARDASTVLVMGGSQGAKGLNRVVLDAVVHVRGTGLHWLHLAGEAEEQNVSDAYRRVGVKAQVYSFCHDMQDLYAATDLVIARAGAASLAEVTWWGLPSILIPYPLATDRHQSANARSLVDRGAALMHEEADCRPSDLAREIETILSDSARRGAMADAARKARAADAHTKLADMVEGLGKGRAPPEVAEEQRK